MDPGDAGGFDLAKIGDIVVVRQVDRQRVDRNGLQFAATFHAIRVGWKRKLSPLPKFPLPRKSKRMLGSALSPTMNSTSKKSSVDATW